MRLLHVTDFHFNQAWYGWLAQVAPDYDVCCLTGDLLNLRLHREVDLIDQVRWVGEWLAAFPNPLCVCSGNHDWLPKGDHFIEVNAEGAWLTRRRRPQLLLDGDTGLFGNWRFVCKPSVGMVDFPTDCPVVLLAHVPPERTGVPSAEFGDFEMAALLSRLPPQSLILAGHVHNPKNWHDTFGAMPCFNPGVAHGGPVPNHIVIDLDRRQAEFFSNGTKSGPIAY